MATSISTDFTDVDGWIQHLMQCKQLPEADVKRLCDKVVRLNNLASLYTYYFCWSNTFV